MDWVTFEDGSTIRIHKADCRHLGKHDAERYARARRKGGDGPYQFHPAESAAERYAREQGYDGRKINRSCSACR